MRVSVDSGAMNCPSAFETEPRVLMGPGPSDVPARVLAAMGRPTVGHLDPVFLDLLDQTRARLREVIGTENELTLPVSGTGSAGMETCVANAVEPGDRVLVGINGVFGQRLAEVARRAGAEVIEVQLPWGRSVDPERMRDAAQGRKFKLLCVVHAETSTGALTPLVPFRELADAIGALLLVDAVTSLAGVPVDMDRMGIDLLYSGTQKCLSCPPGLSPVSLSERARAALSGRKNPVQSWYFDMSLVARYWGGERLYHHTAPINMLYALHEALGLALEETLDARYKRHALHGRALTAGLSAMGLELPVPTAERMPQLTLVRIPDGIDDARTRGTLLDRYGLEIGGGLGVFKGQAFRIGLMGATATRRNVMLCLLALHEVLAEQGFRPQADPLAAAAEAYA